MRSSSLTQAPQNSPKRYNPKPSTGSRHERLRSRFFLPAFSLLRVTSRSLLRNFSCRPFEVPNLFLQRRACGPQPHSLPVTVTLGVPPRSTQPPLQARPFAAASRSRFRKRSVLVAATKSSGLCPGLASRRPFLPAKPLPHNVTEENSPVSAKYAYATLSFPFAYFASEVRAKENPPGRPRSSVQGSLSRSFSHVP